MAAALCALALDLPAEMSGDDYQSSTEPVSPAERARRATEMVAERQREAQAQARRAAQAASRQAEHERLLLLRPPGERLLLARCTTCHTLGVLEGQGRSHLGWRWTVERMRWWHGARLSAADSGLVARHLASTYPSGAGNRMSFFGWAVAVSTALVAAGMGWLVWRRRRPSI
jgi:cytochrome c5